MQLTDGKWKELTDEQLEVFLILSDFVFEFLVEELAGDLQALAAGQRPGTGVISEETVHIESL